MNPGFRELAGKAENEWRGFRRSSRELAPLANEFDLHGVVMLLPFFVR